MSDNQQNNTGKREWCIEDYLEKLRPKRKKELSDHFKASGRQYFEEQDVTEEMLLESYTIMAHIVNLHGDNYLPIFERLHTEIENRKAKKELINKAVELSKNNMFLPD